jgi:DNA-binding NtrC family response regulator
MTANHSTRLLILDDERLIVDTLCTIVKQYGYECRGAYTHSSAVAIAREFRPDVFLTGFVNLCDKNGCETAIEILAFLPRCSVFIFSGAAATAAELERYRQRGHAFEVLPKPLDPQILLEKLRSKENPSG